MQPLTTVLSPQPIFQFHSLCRFLVAIFHNDWCVERDAPLCCVSSVDGPRSGAGLPAVGRAHGFRASRRIRQRYPLCAKVPPHGMLDLVVRSPIGQTCLKGGLPFIGAVLIGVACEVLVLSIPCSCTATSSVLPPVNTAMVSSIMNPGALPAIALSCTPMKLPCRLRVVTAGSVDCACSRGRLELEGVGQNLQGHTLNVGHAFELTTIPTRTLTSFLPYSASHRRDLHKWDR